MGLVQMLLDFSKVGEAISELNTNDYMKDNELDILKIR